MKLSSYSQRWAQQQNQSQCFVYKQNLPCPWWRRLCCLVFEEENLDFFGELVRTENWGQSRGCKQDDNDDFAEYSRRIKTTKRAKHRSTRLVRSSLSRCRAPAMLRASFSRQRRRTSGPTFPRPLPTEEVSFRKSLETKENLVVIQPSECIASFWESTSYLLVFLLETKELLLSRQKRLSYHVRKLKWDRPMTTKPMYAATEEAFKKPSFYSFFAMITSFYLSESRLSYKLNWGIYFRTCMLKLNTSMAWQFWTRDIKVHFQVVEVLKTCIQFATLYFSIHCVRSVIYTLFWEDTKMIFFFKHIHHSLIKIESWSYFIFIFFYTCFSSKKKLHKYF